MLLERVIENRNKIISEIENAELPSFLLDDFPIVLSTSSATINIVFGDSGVGKTLLNQSLMHSVLEFYDDVYVLWFDLEYSADVSKQRGVHSLLKQYENFQLITVNDDVISTFKEYVKKEYTNARYVYLLSKEASEMFPDKKIIVVVDSLEDMIDDTSDDREIKRIFTELLRLRRITFIFSHHINKKETASSLKFRGSMVIKAKLSSLLYIEKKEDINDFEAEYSIDIVKLRTLWNGNRKIIVSIDKGDLRLKDINKNIDSFERKVIRSAYFLLRKSDMKKTELIEAISKQVKANKQSVRNVIEKNNDLFSVSVGIHNTQTYSLNVDKLDELFVVAGLDNDLSDTKKKIISIIDEFNEAGIDDIRVVVRLNGSVIEFKKLSTIKRSIYRLSEYEAGFILEELSKKLDNTEYSEAVDF